MGYFPETIAAKLAGAKVEFSWLVRFDFTSETIRLWRGDGMLKTRDGLRWKGIGALGDVSGIEQAINGEAPQAVFTLSGVDQDFIRKARDEFRTEVYGRRAIVATQFFGEPDEADPDNQRPLDLPYAIWGGRFMTPSFNIDVSGERAISLAAETLFTLRGRPQYAMHTDTDQQHRYPGAGDRGFEFAPTLINKVVTWPDF